TDRAACGSRSKPAWKGKALALDMRLDILQHHTEAKRVLLHGTPAQFLWHQLITGVGNDQTRATAFVLQGIRRYLDRCWWLRHRSQDKALGRIDKFDHLCV